MIIILATMQGYLGYRAIGYFAKTHQHLLVNKFKIASKKVPSYSTIRRVLMGVDWSNLQEIFNQWSSSLVETNELRDWICIDGKTLKSTVTNYNNSYQNFVSLVSLYSQNTGLVLAMNRFENKKSSEIWQVNELVRDSSFTNKVFTLDALHCQKKTTQSIVESGNHYIVCVKKNQKKLDETLQFVANTHKPLSTSLQKERSHGRRVERQVSVFNTIDSLNTSWCGIKSLVRVERRGKRGNKQYHQVAYYISSLKEKAETFLQKIRGHWLIENQLHWI